MRIGSGHRRDLAGVIDAFIGLITSSVSRWGPLYLDRIAGAGVRIVDILAATNVRRN